MPVAEAVPRLKVALINPPFFPRYSRGQRSPGVIRSGTMYYPYWLAHAAAVLDAAGFSIHLYDCPAADIDATTFIQELGTFAPDLCVVETSTASWESDGDVARQIKAALPTTRVCMVGTHVTALWNETLEQFAAVDFVAIGEYDHIVRDLAVALEQRKTDATFLATIPALALRDAEGTCVRGPVRPPIEDVDALPWIAPIYKRFLNPRHYYFSLASYPMVMLIGGRGCQAKCTYCVYPQVMHGHRYRTRSPASIVGEMKWIQDNMPEVQEIVFEDDTFTADRAFARDVAALVKQHGVTLKWFANVRVNIDRETLALMADAGFRCCATGFESGDALLLKNMWKGQSLDQAKAFVNDARDLGILVHGCFMVGFPGETTETMAKTLDLALELRPDSAQFYPVMPFPGTSYFDWARSNGYLATERYSEWLDEAGAHRCIVNLPGLSASEIDEFCERAYRRFYFRPSYLWAKATQALRQPSEGIRSIKSFVNYLWYLGSRSDPPRHRHDAPALPVVSDWYRRHEQPKGRMFRQQIQIEALDRPTSDDQPSSVALEQLAESSPDL